MRGVCSEKGVFFAFAKVQRYTINIPKEIYMLLSFVIVRCMLGYTCPLGFLRWRWHTGHRNNPEQHGLAANKSPLILEDISITKLNRTMRMILGDIYCSSDHHQLEWENKCYALYKHYSSSLTLTGTCRFALISLSLLFSTQSAVKVTVSEIYT